MRCVALAALCALAASAAQAQQRYIPLELILGAPWNGAERLDYPAGVFKEPVANGSLWQGPHAWRHPKTGAPLTVYDRSRGRRTVVDQIFAVRDDGSAIGRVADSRFGIAACDQEAKFPLGIWRAGETRIFDYTCWYGDQPRARRSSIEILALDHDCGRPHCLTIRWIHSDPAENRTLDDRRYTFAPGSGLVELR